MLTNRHLIRWRDWLVENIPDDVLPPAAKSALHNAAVDDGVLQLAHDFMDGSALKLSKSFGPLGCFEYLEAGSLIAYQTEITTYLDRWYGEWNVVFCTVTEEDYEQ